MDVAADFTIPNPFGLLAADFSRDMDGYRAALGFLADLATGTEHDEALALNGAEPASLVAWNRSDKFRRVYAKCRAAGDVEKQALEAVVSDSAATDTPEHANPSGQRFIKAEDLPAQPRTAFGLRPNPSSWGQA